VYSFASGSLEEPINGRTQINFFLGRSAGQPPVNTGNSYGEEIINIGYGSVKRKDMTDQINKINASDKTNASYSNIYEMIKGKVPNVEVSGKSIRIQGSSSFIGESTEPLLVVDGTIVDTIEDISPQSVRSIEILKGPSAAIYGSRGANGVIMISLISAGDR
jgi:TonB-dependent SusC/RagA subfamily outer membrane receptor